MFAKWNSSSSFLSLNVVLSTARLGWPDMHTLNSKLWFAVQDGCKHCQEPAGGCVRAEDKYPSLQELFGSQHHVFTYVLE